MRGDLLTAEGGARSLGRFGVLANQALNSVTTECTATDGREQRVARLALTFAHPRAQRQHRLAGKRRATVLAALAVAAHVGSAAQLHISTGKPGELGAAQARLHSHQEEGAVAATNPDRAIRGREQRVNLNSG